MKEIEVRIVLVGIEGAVNLGIIARTCMNFNVKELYLVSPVASLEEALKYSARGSDLLSRSVIVDRLEKAFEGVDLVAATSAIGYSEGDALRQAISLEDFVDRVIPRARKVAIVFGRESTGLTREELSKADFLVTIPASPEYPVLNVSQAVAIFLWELWKRVGARPVNIPPRATREELEKVLDTINGITALVAPLEDRRKRCELVWRRLLLRSVPSVYEARVLLYWARRVLRKLRGPGFRSP
ncbi:MAG: TrmH family RNA methyltransferase [Desulfurococcaceae archaeon]